MKRATGSDSRGRMETRLTPLVPVGSSCEAHAFMTNASLTETTKTLPAEESFSELM
jgi:hypothetical protein